VVPKQATRRSTITEEENTSCMMNVAPGSTPFIIMSFKGEFLFKLFPLCLPNWNKSFVQRWFPRLNNWSPFNNPLKAIHKLDIPTLDWPIASFPRYKYPLEENKAEDRKCLAEVEEEFERFNKSGRFVAGVIIEPVQAEGGDVHASPEFFQELQRITKKVPGVYRFVPKKIGIVSLILL
jgi:4-aminobutyrate aminotransferase/(S)-3-amino-2-methylpropionate transaminase